MPMTDVAQRARDIHDQFPADAEVTPDEIEERLDKLVNEYKVPVDEAQRSVISTYLEDSGADPDDLQRGNQEVVLADIDAADQWVDVTAKVVELWEPRSDAIGQVGLLGDESGTIKFTAWAKSELPDLHVERVYRLGNVVTDEYQGRYSVKLNRTTTVEEVDSELEVGDNAVEVQGALVDVQRGSGLIKRCPEDDCTRVLQNGRCSEHGDVDGTFDLRIKGVIDDGDSVQDVLFDREASENLTGITLEHAREMAMDALDTSVVADEMRAQILGHYYRLAGPVMGRYLLVDEMEQLEAPSDHQDLLIRARSI